MKEDFNVCLNILSGYLLLEYLNIFHQEESKVSSTGSILEAVGMHDAFFFFFTIFILLDRILYVFRTINKI